MIQAIEVFIGLAVFVLFLRWRDGQRRAVWIESSAQAEDEDDAAQEDSAAPKVEVCAASSSSYASAEGRERKLHDLQRAAAEPPSGESRESSGGHKPEQMTGAAWSDSTTEEVYAVPGGGGAVPDAPPPGRGDCRMSVTAALRNEACRVFERRRLALGWTRARYGSWLIRAALAHPQIVDPGQFDSSGYTTAPSRPVVSSAEDLFNG